MSYMGQKIYLVSLIEFIHSKLWFLFAHITGVSVECLRHTLSAADSMPGLPAALCGVGTNVSGTLARHPTAFRIISAAQG